MAESKQILVVDDHFEMLEFLRSMLELSSQDYEVLGVPSAEEGLFELRRTPFALLISDVRLPGMSGFDLVRKVHQLDQELPVIIITAYATAQGRQEAEELGVVRYFEKPLDTDALLATVHAALYESEPPAQPEAQELSAEVTMAAPGTDRLAERQPVDRRLQSLLTDTGAIQVIVADREGAIVSRVGERRSLDVETLARLVAKNLDNSFLLGEQLQSREPFAIQYQAGDTVDLYFANIERHHFIMLLFDVQERRGRIGTVWIFTQRAIKDLKSLLPAGRRKAEDVQDNYTVPAAGAGQEDAPTQVTREAPDVAPPTDEARPKETDSPVARPEGRDGEESVLPADDPALANALEEGVQEEGIDLDAFWEAATSDVDDDADGLSFEEALRRGLLPPEFGEGE